MTFIPCSTGNNQNTSTATPRRPPTIDFDEIDKVVKDLRNGIINTNVCSIPLEVLNNIPIVTNILNDIAASIDPPSKKEVMKQQLVFLLHAKKCNEKRRIRIHEGSVPTPVSSS